MRNMASFLNRSTLPRVSFIVLLAIWPLVLRNDYAISVMVMAGLYATLTLGIGLLLGQAGQISFGHAAFFGVGAYTAALLSIKLHVHPLAATVAGAAAAGLIAFVVGRPVLRLRFYFLALATIGLGIIFVVVVRQARSLTGGTWGVTGIPWLNFGGFVIDGYLRQYYLVWMVVLLLWRFTERAMNSRVGRALRALAVSETAASTLGIHTADWKLRTFVVSAVYAGIGGSLYAFTLTAINPNDFTITLAILIVIMVMVGGMDSLFGAILGAILMTWVGRAFSGYQEYSGGLYALVLILLLVFLPGGITGGLRTDQIERIRRLFRSRSGNSFPEPGPQPRTREATTNQIAQSPIPHHQTGENTSRIIRAGNSRASAPVSNQPILRLEEVSVEFGGLRALNEVSLEIDENTTTALIGPNGAGKTTLFNVVSGLQKASAGKVWFAGQETTKRSAADIARLAMSRTFQNLRVFANMSVLENVMAGRHRHESAGYLKAGLGLRSRSREEQISREQSLNALAMVGLEHRADRPVTSLPYGEQRLVEIARALATEPRLLLLDEPVAGMNAPEREQLVERIGLIREAGVTVLLVEHDIELVMGISDKVNVLDYGRIIAEGDPETVQTHPDVIKAYLGVRHEDREDDSNDIEHVAEEAQSAITREDGEALLEVDAVSTYYDAIGAVKDVSLRVNSGECFVILGANGAGKTTLLRTISGVLRPKNGRILYDNREITNLKPPQIAVAGIGHVPEGRHVFPTLSVHDNLSLGARIRRDKAEIQNSEEYVYHLFPILHERRRQLAGTLSGGEQQMLAIGRALMGAPKLLLLDEPSMGLAPLVVGHIFNSLATLNQGGLTLLMVEQNAEMALSIAHHAIVIQTGSIALSGSAKELKQDEQLYGYYLGVKQ